MDFLLDEQGLSLSNGSENNHELLVLRLNFYYDQDDRRLCERVYNETDTRSLFRPPPMGNNSLGDICMKYVNAKRFKHG